MLFKGDFKEGNNHIPVIYAGFKWVCERGKPYGHQGTTDDKDTGEKEGEGEERERGRANTYQSKLVDKLKGFIKWLLFTSFWLLVILSLYLHLIIQFQTNILLFKNCRVSGVLINLPCTHTPIVLAVSPIL